MNKYTIPLNLRRLMKEKNVTSKMLARALHVSVKTVMRYRNNPGALDSILRVQEISEHLDVDMKEFFKEISYEETVKEIIRLEDNYDK